MKNIGIIIQKLNGGGAERCAANLSVELSEDYNVKLIVFDNNNQVYANGGEVIDLKMPPSRTLLGKVTNLIKRIHAVKKIKKNHSIDYSISLLEGANLVNVLSRYNEKVIVSERNLISFFETNALSKTKTRIISNMADKVVSLSNMVKQDLVKEFKINESKIVTIYNSCDYKRLSNVSNRTHEILKELDSKYKYIITAGRLTEQKGQCNLIKSFKLVKEKNPDIKLLILGEGELEESLKKLSKSLNVDKDVHFLGYVPDPHSLIERCEAFVFPSIVEGLGNVILEAIACGKTVISSDCDAGPREILAPDTDINYKTKDIEYAKYGVLIPTFSKEECNFDEKYIIEKHKFLSNAIIEIIQNNDKRCYYENQSKKRSEDFLPENIKQHWKELFKELSES